MAFLSFFSFEDGFEVLEKEPAFFDFDFLDLWR